MAGEKTERQEYSTLQAARAFAASVVVLYHVQVTMALPQYFGAGPFPLFMAGSTGVHLFFVLSGLVMVIAHWGQLGRRNNPATFFWKRFRRIYPPLWAALTIVAVSLLILPIGAGPASLGTLLSAYLVAIPVRQEILLGVEWTLRHEILFYALFAVFLWRPMIGGLLLGVWFLGSAVTVFVAPGFPSDFIFSPYHLLFGLGLVTALAVKKDWLGRPAVATACGAALFALGWWLVAFGGQKSGAPICILVFGLGSALLLAGSLALESLGRVRIPRSVVFLGDASYAIYLIHFPVVTLLCKIGAKIGAPQVLWFITSVVLSTAAGVVFHLAVEKPLLRLVPSKWPRRAPADGAKDWFQPTVWPPVVQTLLTRIRDAGAPPRASLHSPADPAAKPAPSPLGASATHLSQGAPALERVDGAEDAAVASKEA
ncbi:acyltransferase [soil metagenome]